MLGVKKFRYWLAAPPVSTRLSVLVSILIPVGLQRLKLLDQLQSCNAVTAELFSVPGPVQSDTLQDYHINTFSIPTRNNGKHIADLMLVLQGTRDTTVTNLVP